MKRLCLGVLTLLAACGPKAEQAHPKPQDFALILPVQVAAGPKIQRIALPPAALLALQRADHGDIRLFDAQDRPLALSLVDAPTAREDQTHLPAIPMAQEGAATMAPVSAPVSVRVEQGQGSITVDTGGANETASPAVLVDTRQISDPVVAITLDASLPVQQPVSFFIAAGDDLKAWEPLAEPVLFKQAPNAALLGGGRVALSAVKLQGRYLRIQWHGAPGAMVTGVTLMTAHTPPPPRMTIAAKGLVLTNAHQAIFSLPTAASPAAIRVTMTGKDGVIPLRLLGRDTPELPWIPLAMGNLRQDGQGAMLEIGDTTARQFKLEADERSAGFSTAPKLDLLFAPITLVAAFNDAAPYRLAVGDAAAAPAFFPLSDIAGKDRALPQSAVAPGNGEPAIDLAQADHAGFPFAPRVMALWLALLAGVSVLGFSAYRLLKTNG